MSLTPVPSDKAEDLLLNVRTIDQFTTGTALTATDRLGNTKPTLAGLREQYPNAEPAAATATAQAGIATTQAGIATTQAGIASAGAVSASTSASSAATAADISAAAGRVYASPAAGVDAGGTPVGVSTGQYYWAVSPTSSAVLDLYRNVGGVATAQGKSTLSAALFASYFPQDIYPPGLSGYSYIFADNSRRMGWALSDFDGSFILPRLGSVQAAFASDRAALADLQSYRVVYGALSGFPWAVAGGLDNRTPLWLNDAGDLISKGINLTQQNVGALQAQIDAINAGVSPAITPSKNIACWGDSITFGSGTTPWPQTLQGLFTDGRTVTNYGRPGETSYTIAFRQGALKYLLTVTGNTIPASGAVAVTAITAAPDGVASVLSAGFSYHGKLYGIPGTFGRDLSNNNTFTRDTAGTAVVIDTKTPFLIDEAAHLQMTATLMLGRNNATSKAIEHTRLMIAYLHTLYKHVVVLPILNNASTERLGMSGYTAVMAVNDAFRAEFPGEFCDVRALLVRSYDPGIPQDVLDFNDDVVPSSLRMDVVPHPNTAGNNIIAAAVHKFITAKGW